MKVAEAGDFIHMHLVDKTFICWYQSGIWQLFAI